jgi:hypothetical protein
MRWIGPGRHPVSKGEDRLASAPQKICCAPLTGAASNHRPQLIAIAPNLACQLH